MPKPIVSSPRARRSALAIALTLALPFGQAVAQDVSADASAQNATPGTPSDNRHAKATSLDAVVVTATPLQSSAEELAQPVEVLAGEKLDEARATTLGETVGKLPGVQSSNFGAGVGRPIIRGQDGPRVAVMTGGLATQDVSTVSQDHNVTVEPFLADQIEVLKGPATLLYGSGAIGGVVNVVDGRIAEKPLDETVSGRAEIRRSTVNDGVTGMARVDASGADGALVLHADGVYRNNDDYQTPLGRQRNSFVDTKTGALGASLVGDLGFLGFSAARYEDKYGNPGEPGNAEEGESPVHIDMKQNRFELKGGINQEFGIFSGLRASVANTEYEHTEFEGSEVGTRFLSDATEGRFELTHKPLAGWIGALGVQGYDRKFQAIGEEAFVPHTKTRAGGLFLTEQRKWDQLQVELGARIDRVEVSPQGADKRNFNPLSLSAGVLWKFNDAWRLTFNADRAERAPAEEELFADGLHAATASYEIGDANLRKERANQFELGLHYHGAKFEAKLAAYQTRFDGFIYLLDTGGFDEENNPIRQWSQADAKFTGFEGEAIAHLFDGDAGKFDVRVFGDSVRAKLDNGGGNLPRIAPGRVGGELRWNADSWRASLGATRYMKQDKVAANETPTDGYTLVDAHLAYHWDAGNLGYELFLDGTNLTDQTARVHTSFLKDSVVLPGRGVDFGVRVFF
ncbi:TonB-dependent receptor [Pseudomonas sp. CGJS7]|uniref:TonB-dependent receptor n=1 Tax=Pseudomonas sp. CGJS7 TaxID=3109348 RepID=UPI00300BB402